MARLATFILIVAAAVGTGLLISRSPFDRSASEFLRFGISAVFWGAVLCSVAVWSKATKWSLKKRFSVLSPLLFCLIILMLMQGGTLLSHESWFALLGCISAGIAAILLIGQVFLAPQIWGLFRALDVPKLAEKDDDQ
jgi:hypothetical protein